MSELVSHTSHYHKFACFTSLVSKIPPKSPKRGTGIIGNYGKTNYYLYHQYQKSCGLNY